jgi:hypothetical protein
VEQLFQFVVGYSRLYLWLSRIEAEIGKKEVGQESDVREMREEDSGAVVLPVALGSEDQSQSTAV